jgi:outer membrane receptor protein involved in Fe transport
LRCKGAKSVLGVWFLLLFISTAIAANEVSVDELITFNVPEQRIDLALTQFAEQADITLLFPTEAMAELMSNELIGTYSVSEGADILLAGTGLIPTFKNKLVLNIVHDPDKNNEEADMNNRQTARGGLLAAVFGIFATSGAQAADPSSAAPAERGMEEIIVSATRRDTVLMDTPMSIAVVSAEDIETKGIVDFKTLYQTVPGMAYRTNGSTYNTVGIRGLTAPGEGGSTVGIYIDNVSVTDSNSGGGISQIAGSIFDLQSIEVLKGPQGTLYGESTLGGAIRYIANAPDPTGFDYGVKVESEQMQDSDDLTYRVNAMINAPITDTLALRLTGSYRDRAGLIDVPAPRAEDDVDWQESEWFRGKLLWTPTGRMAIGLSAQLTETDYGGPGVADFLGGYSNAGLAQPDFPNGGTEKVEVYSFSLDYEFEAIDLEFTSSRFERSSNYGEETTPRFGGAIVGLTNFLIGQFDPSLAGLNPIAATGGLGLFRREAERDIHEFRILSNSDSDWQWSAGLYYKEDQAINGSDDPAEPGFWLALAPGFEDARPTVQQFIDPILAGFFTKATIDSTEKAVFGEVSYRFSDEWELLVGARATEVKRDTDQFDEDITDDFISPKVSIRWRPQADLMSYLTISQGFRPGVVNTDLPGVIAQLEAQVPTDPSAQGRVDFFRSKLTVDGDEVLSYELGLKTTLWNGRGRLSAALYHLDWKDTLVFQPLSELTGLGAATIGQSYNDNLDGGAVSQGAEFELAVDITSQWGMNIAYDNNWTAESKGDAAGSLIGPDGEIVIAEKGNRLPNSPKYSWSISTDYEFPVGSWTGNARLDWYRVDDAFNAITNEIKTDGYDQVDVRLTLFSPDQKWRAAFYVANVTDEMVTYECNEGGCIYGRPLTVGASISYGL